MVTTSKVQSLKTSASAGPWKKRTCGEARSWATSRRRLAMSTPNTSPEVPTRSAAIWVTRPVPQPTSSRRSPGRGDAISTRRAPSRRWMPEDQSS